MSDPTDSDPIESAAAVSPDPADPHAERPFTLSVPEVDLSLLRKRLDLVRLPDELLGAERHYGAPLADVRRLVAHWRGAFDWRAAEARINELPMFVRGVEVDGFGTLEVHYVHWRSAVAGAIPLLFVHGWPGHFLEVRKMLPLLTASEPDHPSFHVVALSLPGFGFSEAPKKPGFAGPQYAEVFNKLMLALGYDKYVYQGGDWGHILGTHAVDIYGHKHIKAWLTNLPVYRDPTLFTYPLYYLQKLLLPITTRFNDKARKDYEDTKNFYQKGRGYFIEQATDPQTIGYSLADSPVGLLAWIYEKLVSWTDNYPWTDDEVLEWISVYWFSRAGPAAASRIYHEMTGGQSYDWWKGSKRTTVPLGAAYFPAEGTRPPKQWLNMLGKVVFRSEHDRGGHFAAFEQPELLAGDLRKMFGKGGPAYGAVPGKDGYN